MSAGSNRRLIITIGVATISAAIMYVIVNRRRRKGQQRSRDTLIFEQPQEQEELNASAPRLSEQQSEVTSTVDEWLLTTEASATNTVVPLDAQPVACAVETVEELALASSANADDDDDAAAAAAAAATEEVRGFATFLFLLPSRFKKPHAYVALDARITLSSQLPRSYTLRIEYNNSCFFKKFQSKHVRANFWLRISVFYALCIIRSPKLSLNMRIVQIRCGSSALFHAHTTKSACALTSCVCPDFSARGGARTPAKVQFELQTSERASERAAACFACVDEENRINVAKAPRFSSHLVNKFGRKARIGSKRKGVDSLLLSAVSSF